VVVVAVLVLSVFVSGSIADADVEDVSGTLASTRTISGNARLVGDVTCTMTDSPCIDFGASHIKLRLNGFTITGPAAPDSTDPANPAAFCNANPGSPAADGIRIGNQTHTQILGPGVVQKFRRHGVFVVGTIGVSTKVRIARITSHHNCFSGILMSGVSDSLIEGNASVRNGINSGPAPCGGNCIVNSHNNHIRRNTFAGNGSVANGNNDFGVGLIAGSSGNLLEENTIGGNTNGVLLQGDTSGNVIRGNVIVGNPPSQVSRTFGANIGADIKDESLVPGSGTRNIFESNWCVTYQGPGPAVCPSFPDRRDKDDDD
jgi:parallel beta-helix repeat protein